MTDPIHHNPRGCRQIFVDTTLTCRSGWFHTWTRHSPAWAWSRRPAGGRGSGRCWCSAQRGARGWSQSTGSRCLPKRAKKMLVSTSPGKFVTQWKQANRPSSKSGFQIPVRGTLLTKNKARENNILKDLHQDFPEAACKPQPLWPLKLPNVKRHQNLSMETLK